MSASQKDFKILRDLAKQISDISEMPEQSEKIRLWKACNDLKPERAMVYADPQNGWSELDRAWIKLECENPSFRGWEFSLRRRLMRYEYIPDDFPVLNTFNVDLRISGAGYDDYGFSLQTTRPNQQGGAYHIEPVIKTEQDIAKLHFRPIKVDHEGTERNIEMANDLFGDILNVRKVGKSYWRYGLSRVLIHMRGLDNMMLDLYDNPNLIKKLMEFLMDDFINELDIMEQEHAFSLNNSPDGVNGSGGIGYTSDLPEWDSGQTPYYKGCRCWAESQETVGVGPKHFDEFVLHYQLPLMERFGLVDYGCCEPLDHKLDILIKKIPHLRWVAVSPWSDRRVCADKIQGRYVYVYKPNPSLICSPRPDWEQAEKEIRETLEITNGNPTHIIMKDTNTFCNEPERITRWAEIASRVAKEMA
ncbi:MAG: hypothetical protein QG588_2248 [Candidatus Poribacteria bacterium]|nr:hypothetical protein [Candidatus Poribacteria bacterium]